MRRVNGLAWMAAAVVCGALVAAEKIEPRYRGKPVAYWIEKLRKGESFQEQKEAGLAIIAFGHDAAPAIPMLVEMVDDRSAEFRLLIHDVLVRLGPVGRSAAPLLATALTEGRIGYSADAILILVAIGKGAKETVPAVSRALRKRSVREAAVQGLCDIGPAAKGSLPAIRQAVLAARREIVPEGSPRWYDLLSDFSRLGPDAVPVLAEFLDQEDARRVCVRELGKLGPAAKRVTPRLTGLLGDGDLEVRRAAAEALWRIDKRAAVIPVLADLVRIGTPEVHLEAAATLGRIGPEARPALPVLKAIPNPILVEDVVAKIEGKEPYGHLLDIAGPPRDPPRRPSLSGHHPKHERRR